jgi:hypothetical protein
MDYDVFLSHNSKDKPAVEQIATLLREKYGLKCWLDKWNLVPGEPWQEALEDALDQCRTVAVFVGVNDVSPWENEEMRSALETRVHDKERRVIPVLLPGAPDRGHLKLPRFLSRLTWVDFRGGLEDENALYRLYCGIQGITPGADRRNAQAGSGGLRIPPKLTTIWMRLRRRRAIWLAFLVMLVILGLIGMSVFDFPVFCGRKFSSAPGYINLATDQRNSGRYACALNNLQNAIRANPSSIEKSNIYYLISSIHLAKLRPTVAIENAAVGLEIDAAYQDLLHASKGLAYCQLRQNAGALEEFGQFLELNPNSNGLLASNIIAILKNLENGDDMSDVCWVISTDSLP